MKFKKFGDRVRKQQEFDKNATFTRAGRKICIYDMIQEAQEDSEIYQTLEKYGCLDRLQTNYGEMYGDFTQIPKDLRDLTEHRNKIKEMFYELDVKDREYFNHDVNNFIRDGEKFLLEKEQAKNAIEQPTQTETKTTTTEAK